VSRKRRPGGEKQENSLTTEVTKFTKKILRETYSLREERLKLCVLYGRSFVIFVSFVVHV